jgi:serine protease Do
MSSVLRRRLKLTGYLSAAFAAGVLLAGALELPRSMSAQGVTGQSAAALRAPGGAVPAPANRSLVDLSEAFASLAEHVRPSVVFIKAERQTTDQFPQLQLPPGFERFFQWGPGGPPGFQRPQYQEAAGSGFIVSPDGYILTNAHVVGGSKQVSVRLLDRREFKAKIVGTDPSTDLAVLKIDAQNLTPAPLGNSDAARVGEWVLAVGNPLGEDLTFTVTSGIVSAKGRALNLPNRSDRSIQDFIQTDAAINPGNSGGPLVNVRGEVIGVNAAIASQTGYYSGYGFAIPINLARVVMDQLIHGGKVHRAALGILVRDATANDAQYVGLPEVRGVLIQDFAPEGKAAERAGLEPGDIIVAIDGQPVQYTAQLQQRIAFRKPGEVVQVEVARKGGVRKTVSVPLQAVTDRTETASAGERDNRAGGRGNAAPMATLGVTVAPLERGIADEFDVPRGLSGVVVTDVRPGGPAYESVAGPDNGGPDIILSVEGRAVRTPEELRDALRGRKPGEIVSLRIYNARAKAYRIERVKLGEPPSDNG